MSSELSAILFGLMSATSWGAGDFSGGIATKKSSVFNVIIISQTVGLSLLVILAFLYSEPFPSLNDILWGGLAGLFGAIGLMALYRGLALQNMGVVAPVSAVVTVIIPMGVGMLLEGFPTILQLLGCGIALIAVWFVSSANDQGKIQFRTLDLPIIAGLGFGFFFVFIDQISEGSIFWPLTVARIASITTLVMLTIVLRQLEMPQTDQLPIIALAGIFDVGGNAFFVLAAQMGRLDIAAVLGALYPVVTVVLARIILKERLTHQQWSGIIAALISVFLITSGS
ncbi:MAG: EamA family transporter [Candidatus Hermodarchaeota archaeon]